MHAPKPKGYHSSGQPTDAKNSPDSLGNNAEKEPKPDGSETRTKAPQLEWEQINSVTWRLADRDGPKVETPRCHGHWQGFLTPKALAWVFDVGTNGAHDWRVRVRKRGGWLALGSVIDADLGKRLAQAAVDGVPFRNAPPDSPLNLLGGDRRWPKKRNDITTRAKIVHAEVGGEILESADIVPPPGDSESINTSAPDDEWQDWPPADDTEATE
jgi:hypothetical protein